MKKRLATSKEKNTKRENKSQSIQVELQNLISKSANVAPVAIHKLRLGPDGSLSMPYSTPAIENIYGMKPEELQEDFMPVFKMIHSEDIDSLNAAMEKSKQSMEVFHHQWRLNHPDRGEVWVECHSTPELEDDGGIAWYGYLQDITELKKAEQVRQSQIYFFASMDQVNRAIQGASSLEQMMGDVLDCVLSIFNCDRAWLCNPCNPDAETWNIPMERTSPEYPGVFSLGKSFPMDSHVARNMKIVLQYHDPVSFGPGLDFSFTGDVAKEFNIQSSLMMAIYPKVCKPWMFGLHQCSHVRIWTEEDKELLAEIGRRLSDGLTSLLVSRDLQESEERFRQTFEFAGVGVGILGLDRKWLKVNHSFCDMLGYSEEELQAMTSSALTHPEDVIQCEKSERKLLTDDISYTLFEKRYRHKNGHYLWTRVTSSLVKDDNNKPLYFVVQIEDIDQLKQDEADISLLSFALNNVKDIVHLADEEAHLCYVNDEACRHLGYSREELLQMSVPDFSPEFTMEVWQERWAELKKEGSVTIESVHKTKAGKAVPVEVNANYFEYGGRAYCLALLRDISERQQTEEQISLLNFAFNRAQEAHYLIDEDAKFEYVNETACQMLGYSRDELLNLRIPDIDPDCNEDELLEMRQQLISQGSFIIERAHKTKAGKLIPVEVHTNYFEYNGRFHNLTVVRDITERQQVEKERIANLRFFESMDRINRSIQGAQTLEQMMSDVLDSLRSIFQCDRAWLLYPCDPSAETFRVPMECTEAEYPGGFAAGTDFPIEADVAEVMQLCLDSDGPVAIRPESENPVVPKLIMEYQVQSFIAMALYPKVGGAWMFGLHQCSYPRVWTNDDKKLLGEIGRRLTDGLTSLLVSRDLQESEERFRQAFEFAGIGVAILSIEGQWLRTNHTLCEMLGYSEEELQQTTYQELSHPDDLVRGKDEAEQLIAGDIPFMQIEKRYRRKDGLYIWTKLTTSIMRSSTGEPLYFVSQIEDIDQLKQDEQQITLLNFAMNRINEGVFLTNEHGDIEYVNDKGCQSLGYSRDELLKLGVPDIDPDYQKDRWREHWEYIKQRGSEILETIHKRKDGQIYPVEINANYFEYDGRGYNLALERDITERKLAEEALHRSEAELQIALDAGQLGDWKWDLANDELEWSARCKAIFGLPPDAEMSPEIFRNLVHPDDRAEVARIMERTIETGGDYETVKRHIMPDGKLRWTIGRGRLIYNEQGEPTVMAGITMDITERVLAEEARHEAELALLESDERFRQMAESIEEVFWLTDLEKKKMLYVSPAYESVWGGSCEELYSDPMLWFKAIHPDDKQHVYDALLKSRTTGSFDIEYRILRPDGTERTIHDRAFPIYDSSGKLYRISGVAQDITVRKEQDARIEYLAYHDALTGLPNRTLVMNRLDQAIGHAHRHKHTLAVLFVDLDHFKTINDTLGHIAGDTLLQKAGICLADILREEDTIGRVGGDEFLILLPGLDSPQDAAYVTEKIIDSFSKPFKVAGHELHINASVGISLYPRDAKESETLVKYADSALYLAKEQGRNTFRFFSPELDARVRARLHMENDLRYAIERNELFLQYQPQIDQTTGRFIGAEALLRWQHPIHGLVSPAEFIPIAEETGLIIPIGEWVLRTACTQARAWESKGIDDFLISVNLSRRQLEQKYFADTVHQILEETGCRSRLLELEITESSAMSEPEEAIVKLKALHDIGIQLAIDDFGTGYSSLAYLKQFPFDRLKIDQSFVSGIPDDSDDIAIIQITIMLAHQLRLKVIAEGVETETQREFLKENGCYGMQGYLFGKPQSPEELEKYCQLLSRQKVVKISDKFK